MEPVTAATGPSRPTSSRSAIACAGFVGAAREDDPAAVEADLRAGVAGLAAFGAVGDAARAEEELARWLIAQGRSDEAEPLLDQRPGDLRADRRLGWLAQMDAEVSTGS